MISKSIIDTIKTAILEAQYKAAKAVNAVQLSLYFSIGKYVSEHTRKGYWGTGALEYISEQLQRELPGLRGFSATNLKRMRVFYEEWASDSLSDNYNSTVMTVELQSGDSNSSLASDELELGVATFRTADEMPEPLRKALPNIEELKKLL